MIEQRRREPRDDLISVLTTDIGDKINNDEIVGLIVVLMFAGHETTTGPVEAGTTTIPAGANVALMIGAANRDTRKWPDADQLRLDRPNPNPISFGHGIHHCLGAALARLEMRVALPAFLNDFGDDTVDHDTAVWKRSNTLRGLTHLNVHRSQ